MHFLNQITLDMVPLISFTLAVASVVFMVWGYYEYKKKVFSKEHDQEIKPNPVTWTLWAFGGALSTWTLFKSVAEDPFISSTPFVCMILSVWIVYHSFRAGKFQKPEISDILILLLDLTIILFWSTNTHEFWWPGKGIVVVNIIVQVDVLLTFLPIYRSAWSEGAEMPKPWMIWSVSYALMVVLTALRMNSYWELLYSVNYLVLHFLVGVIAFFRRHRHTR